MVLQNWGGIHKPSVISAIERCFQARKDALLLAGSSPILGHLALYIAAWRDIACMECGVKEVDNTIPAHHIPFHPPVETKYRSDVDLGVSAKRTAALDEGGREFLRFLIQSAYSSWPLNVLNPKLRDYGPHALAAHASARGTIATISRHPVLDGILAPMYELCRESLGSGYAPLIDHYGPYAIPASKYDAIRKAPSNNTPPLRKVAATTGSASARHQRRALRPSRRIASPVSPQTMGTVADARSPVDDPQAPGAIALREPSTPGSMESLDDPVVQREGCHELDAGEGVRAEEGGELSDDVERLREVGCEFGEGEIEENEDLEGERRSEELDAAMEPPQTFGEQDVEGAERDEMTMDQFWKLVDDHPHRHSALTRRVSEVGGHVATLASCLMRSGLEVQDHAGRRALDERASSLCKELALVRIVKAPQSAGQLTDARFPQKLAHLVVEAAYEDNTTASFSRHAWEEYEMALWKKKAMPISAPRETVPEPRVSRKRPQKSAATVHDSDEESHNVGLRKRRRAENGAYCQMDTS